MNSLNYATLEASQRLRDAGIVLETELYWRQNRIDKTWKLVNYHHADTDVKYCPAPSMAEVWRELPEYIEADGYTFRLMIVKIGESTSAHYSSYSACRTLFLSDNTNPTDALIDLLIWVRKEKL